MDNSFQQVKQIKKVNLTEHYNELYKTSIKKVENDAYHTDFLIGSPNDKRYGISLLVRPPQNIKNNIQLFLDDLEQIDPCQYYYPGTDIHITIMSIISCYEGFKLEQISISDYSQLIKNSIHEVGKFIIKFQGITASDSSIMIQGFPENDILNNLRDRLRSAFRSSNLKQSIDKRYTLQTAHSTVVRFREKLLDKNKFIGVLEKNKNSEFGTFEANELELVFNDWYHSKKNSKLLEKFQL